MIANVPPQPMTPDEYLAWEAEQPIKHEYMDGEVYARMTGTLPHDRIAVNLTSVLRTALRGKGCKVWMADAKVRISEHGPYFYPDLVVSCVDRDRQATDAIYHPTLIVEVLSPSTAAFDRGDKFKFYRRLPTLKDYLLIDASQVRVDCYRQGDTGRWELTAYPEDAADATDPVLALASFNLQFPLAEVYEGVKFPQPLDREERRTQNRG